jgi:hypothetical protein
MLSRNGVKAKHLRFFVAALLRMTGIWVWLGALKCVPIDEIREII